MRIRIGEMDQRIRIEREERVSDGIGGSTREWVELADNVPAHVRPLRGGERMQAQQVEASADYMVVIRNRYDVKASDRIVWNGMVLNIRHAAPPSKRAQFRELEAQSGVAT